MSGAETWDNPPMDDEPVTVAELAQLFRTFGPDPDAGEANETPAPKPQPLTPRGSDRQKPSERSATLSDDE